MSRLRRRHAPLVRAADRQSAPALGEAEPWPDRPAIQSEEPVSALIARFERETAQRPDDPSLALALGYAYKDAARLTEAEACFARALHQFPQHAGLLHAHGLVQLDLGRSQEALQRFDQVHALLPTHPAPLASAARAALTLHRLDAAIDYATRALQLDGDLRAAMQTLRTALFRAQRIAAALALSENLAARPASTVEQWMLRSAALDDLGRHEEALGCALHALECAPTDRYAQFNAGLCALRLKRYASGWPLWQARLKIPGAFVAQHPGGVSTAWEGETALEGKTVFVYAEQGLGDCIQFARYLPHLSALGARVELALIQGLEPLFEGFADVTLVHQGAASRGADHHCSLLSLPYALMRLGVSDGTVPPLRPFQVSAAQKAAWRHRLGPPRRPRIGLAVSGNPDHANDAHRSIPLALFAPLFRLPVELVCLQPQLRVTDQEVARALGLQVFAEELRDFAAAAGLASLCDLVISVDSAPAHLAASLQRPTWILLPHLADWRWGVQSERTDWYPAARLWRQGPDRDWPAVIEQLTQALATRF